MSTTVRYKGSTLATAENQTKVLKTAGKYMEDDVTITDVSQGAPVLQTKSVTPSETAQAVTADTGYDGLEEVDVAAVSSTYVGTGITRRSSSDLTASGATVNVPAGYYASQGSKAVASGTEGTPTATKGSVSNHSVTVTPSVTNTAGYIAGGTKTGTGVSVTASELVSGNKSITENGTNIDVTNYETVSVAVPGSSATLITKSITANGTYNASSDNADGYSSVEVNVSGGGGGTSYTLVKSAEITANTTSTSVKTLSDTIQAGSNVYTSNSLIYIKIRNKAGKVNGYHFGNDCYVSLSNPAAGAAIDTTAMGNICYYYYNNNLHSYGPINYGISVSSVSSSGEITLQARYNSSYTKTINGTYVVDVYLLEWPNNMSPFV